MSATELQFGGEERFPAAVERVRAVLSDVEALAALLPDVDSTERVNATTLRCVVRPGVSFLRGKLTSTIAQVSSVPPADLAWQITAKGIGVEIELATSVQLHPVDDGTLLTWQAAIVRRQGLVAALSPSLLQAAAEQTIRRGWQRLRETMSQVRDSRS